MCVCAGVFCSVPLLLVYVRMRIFESASSIAGLLFDSVGSLRTTSLLRTICIRSWCNWSASCVAAFETKNQKPKTNFSSLFLQIWREINFGQITYLAVTSRLSDQWSLAPSTPHHCTLTITQPHPTTSCPHPITFHSRLSKIDRRYKSTASNNKRHYCATSQRRRHKSTVGPTNSSLAKQRVSTAELCHQWSVKKIVEPADILR